jgi:AcrR family transcriptional regulator
LSTLGGVVVTQSTSLDEAAGEVGEPHKRADARRNRAQILEAAELLFAEQGIGVPIDEIAHKAGVGVGTVYRHFPTKEALAGAVVMSRMEALVAEAEGLTLSEDAGGAFFAFLELLSGEALAKHDLIDALSGAGIDFKEISSGIRPRLEEVSATLLERAQAAGEIRRDVEMADLFGLVIGTCEMAGKETRCSHSRMMSIVLDGLRTKPD